MTITFKFTVIDGTASRPKTAGIGSIQSSQNEWMDGLIKQEYISRNISLQEMLSSTPRANRSEMLD